MRIKIRRCLGCQEQFEEAVHRARKRCVPCAKKHMNMLIQERRMERMKDPEYRKKINARFLAWRTKRLRSNPEYKKRFDVLNEKARLRLKKRRQEDPEYKKHVTDLNKATYEKRMKNPEYHKQQNALSKERYHKNSCDPEYRARVNATIRKHRVDCPEQVRAAARKAYAKKVSTPEGRAEHNKRHLEYMYKRRANDSEYQAEIIKQSTEEELC